MNKVLWLPSWYPSKFSAQNGDFIKRHAQCVSGLIDLRVLYIIGVSGTENDKSVRIERNADEAIAETVIEYNRYRSGFYSKIISFIKYFSLNVRAIKSMIRYEGLPDLVHVHVAMRAGMLALWIKWKYGIPYILSEHWTIYTYERLDNYSKRNFIFRSLVKKIIDEASALTVVSDSLGKGIQKMVVQKPFIKIPNVVDIDVFNYQETRNEHEFVFIHVSGMKDIKNPKGIINAFAKLTAKKKEIKLVMVGDAPETIISYAESKGLRNDNVVFKGILEYSLVAQELKAADAFVLFSHSENLPCVIAESLCCGVPVISTNVGGVPEMIDEQNGMLVSLGDELGLLTAMEQMLHKARLYDHKSISAKAQSLYNPSTIGRQFNDLYEKILSERK